MRRATMPPAPKARGLRGVLARSIYGVLNSMYGGLTWGANYLFASSAYASTDFAKQTLRRFRPQSMTADSALYGSLTLLIAQSRQLERSTPLGRAFVDALASELVGSGIGISPNTGDGDRDELLKAEFNRWAEHAMLDGSSLWSWQSACARELGTAGAALARILVRPERSAKGWLPLCIMPLEVEWLSIQPVTQQPEGHAYFRGIELDQFGLPVFYHLRHPYSMSGGERVAAADVIHIFEKRRPQQTHGEPMMAPAIERILQDSRIVEAELQAALATSAPVGSITTEGAALPGDGEDSTSDDPQIDFQAGSVARLIPGEKIEWHDNKRVTEDMHPFRAEIRGDVAAAGRFSAWWLDRDPSRANYSSMRMDQLLSKRGTVSLKEILGTGCAGRPYELALPWICLRNGLEFTPDMLTYGLRPDQPEYVDPLKDVKASAEAVAAQLSTLDIECSSRGKDATEVIKSNAQMKKKIDAIQLERIAELQELCNEMNAKTPNLNITWAQILALSGADTAPGAYLQGVSSVADSSLGDGEDGEDEEDASLNENGKKEGAA